MDSDKVRATNWERMYKLINFGGSRKESICKEGSLKEFMNLKNL